MQSYVKELINKLFYINSSHYVALSGGNENSLYRVSANFKDKTAIDIASKRQEYGIRANFNHKTLEGLLEITGNISQKMTKEDYTDYNAFAQAVKLNPTLSVMDPKNPMIYQYLYGFDTWNPVAELRDRENYGKNEYNIIDLGVKLNLLNNLNTELKVSRQGHNYKHYEWYPTTHRESINENRKGRARLESEQWEDYTLEWVTNYYKTINQHNIKLMGGYSYQIFNWEKFWAENADFPSDAFKYNNLDAGAWNLKEGRLGMDSEKQKENNVAFFGRINYSYADTYLFTASLRKEGNSKYGKDHKWGWFPAASLAWRISNLPALQKLDFINDLKIRVSYGETGRSGFDRYIAQAYYKGFGKYLDDNGQWIQVYGPGNNPNYNLHWEKQRTYNFGVDYTLLNQRISGSLDYFIRKGDDLISEFEVAVPPYLHSKMFMNVISTNTRGMELNLNWDAIKAKDFNYSTNLILSYAKTKAENFSNNDIKGNGMDVASLPSPGNPGDAQRIDKGMEIGSFFGGKYAGVDDKGEIMIWEKGIIGGNKKPASQKNSEDRVYLGNGMPRWEMSCGHTFQYKNFDLTLFLRGKFDYKILNLYQMYYGLQKQPNVNLLKDAFNRNNHIKGEKHIVDYFLENGDYLKLDNITLGYTPKLSTKWMSNLRIYGSIRNVFTITKYSGLDPANTEITGLTPGIGKLDLYPSTTNISFGIQVTY